MAGLRARIPFGPIQLVASNAKTLVVVAAPSNQRVKVVQYFVGFDGTTATDAHVELRELTVTGVGSGGTAVTPAKLEPSMGEAVQTTAKKGPASGAWTTDPDASGATVLAVNDVAPTNNFVWQYVPGKEPMIAGGGFWALDAKPGTNTPNARGWVEIEE